MALKDWSATAASNNSAPPDGAPENMAPSAVNNTIREVMAVVKQTAGQAEYARDYTDFAAAITAIGATKKTLIITESEAVTGNVTVPANVTLQFLHGGDLNISTSMTVTSVNAPIAGPYQIIKGAGTFTISTDNSPVWAEWWGAAGDWNGSTGTDNSAPFTQALNSSTHIKCAGQHYKLGTAVVLPVSVVIEGVGAFQNSDGRDTRFTFTGTSGWGFDYPNSDALDSEFKGPWEFNRIKMFAPNISGDINGGCIKIGNSDTASFASYNTCGRVVLRNCEITTGSNNGIGLFLIKVFDPQIEGNVFTGANYGIWGFGTDISQIGKTNRFNANGTHVRWTVSGSYSGSLDLDHNDMLASTYVAVWLEGCIAPALTKNYIENVAAGTALATAQTGTVAQNDLDTTLTGTGTTFLTQLAQTAFGGDRRRVLIKVGDEYRQVLSTASDTSATLDAPFPYSFTGQAWSICYGVGIIASSATNIKQEDNRIDITATSGAVPRAYYFSSQADINDVGGENADQGRIVFADNTINVDRYNVRSARMQPNIRMDQPGYFDLYPGAPGHNNIRSQHFIDGWKKHNPVLVYDHRYFFQDATGGGKAYQDAALGPMLVYLDTVGNISTLVPDEFLDVPCILRWRMKSISSASTDTFYHATASQGTDTSIASDTINTTWTEGAFRGVVATTAEPYLTMARTINLHNIEYISIEKISTPVVVLADSVAATVADLKADFNTLLQNLRDAGIQKT